MTKKRLFNLALLLVSILFLQPNTLAQDHTQWGLPDGAKARLGKGRILDIAHSPDGTQLAVASAIGIWLYDLDASTAVTLLRGHADWVLSVTFSPDGKRLPVEASMRQYGCGILPPRTTKQPSMDMAMTCGLWCFPQTERRLPVGVGTR